MTPAARATTTATTRATTQATTTAGDAPTEPQVPVKDRVHSVRTDQEVALKNPLVGAHAPPYPGGTRTRPADGVRSLPSHRA